jgi:hypothetical protein
MGFDVDSFLEGLSNDKTPERVFDRITKILMNTRDNQGTIVMLPFINTFNSNFYVKVAGVKEFYGYTSLIDNGEGWYKILPREFYGELTQKQEELYNEILGYYDSLFDADVFSYDKIRHRNYSLMYGKLISHTKTDKTPVTDNVGKACLFIFPSLSPIDALGVAVSQKVIARNNKKDWIPKILSVTGSGRNGAVAITFSKSTSYGYDTSIGFEFNTEDDQIVDPKEVFGEELTKYFKDSLQDFLGWQYDRENNTYFNDTLFTELRDCLLFEVKEMAKAEQNAQPPLENKNGGADPIKSAPTTTSAAATVNDDLPF